MNVEQESSSPQLKSQGSQVNGKNEPTFEKETILLWLRTRGSVCPITGEVLREGDLEPAFPDNGEGSYMELLSFWRMNSDLDDKKGNETYGTVQFPGHYVRTSPIPNYQEEEQEEEEDPNADYDF